MSYVVMIWEQPENQALPETAEQAWEMVRALQESEETSQKLEDWAKDVRESGFCPCVMCQETGKGEGYDCAWLEGPPRAGGSLVCNQGIGLSATEANPMILLVEKAQAHGLHVLDPQSGQMYLFDGTPRPVESAPEPEYELPRASKVNGAIYDAVKPLMVAHGYKGNKKEYVFTREIDGGRHEIHIDLCSNRWPIDIGISVYVVTKFTALEDIHTQFDRESDWTGGGVRLSQREWMMNTKDRNSDIYRITSRKHLDEVIGLIKQALEDKLLAYQDYMNSIFDYDQQANALYYAEDPNPHVDWDHYDHHPYPVIARGIDGSTVALVAAHLSSNPYFERMCEERLRRYPKEFIPTFLKFVDFLKQQPRLEKA